MSKKIARVLIQAFVSASLLACPRYGEAGEKHTFTFGGVDNSEFLLDGKPFQIRGGEMHPGRIPPEYWRHRIQMAKAMGLNTIPIYIFWNDHEREEGKFDFSTGSRNIGEFLKIAGEEGMWVVLRPGPYVCGEWDLGGLPSYLLRDPTIKLRCSDPRYTQPVERYLRELAKVVRPQLAKNGGPILMVQIENEYGSYPARDLAYMKWLRDLWVHEGVEGPFCTSDGPSEYYLKGVTLPGVAVGLDPGLKEADWAVARKMNPGVPVFSAETYPGWLRRWGEGDWRPTDVSAAIKFYMATKKSFSLYVFHGGSNFGFTAGANAEGKGGYLPDLTSYDYGAPLDEQGNPTPAYYRYRNLLAGYLGPDVKLPEVPAPIPAITIPTPSMERWTTLWDAMPAAVESEEPAYFESALLNQNQGIVVYRTTLPPGKAGILKMDARDYAQVFVDGKHLKTLSRVRNDHTLELPARTKAVTLDILVEAMGHINFKEGMETDRKGLVGDVTLDGVAVQSWKLFPFPLKDDWITSLPQTQVPDSRLGGVFKGTFTLDTVADTFIDMRHWNKGVVWVNGHNLGRHWDVGPQYRLYCPAPWLKKGENTIVILDLEAAKPLLVAEPKPCVSGIYPHLAMFNNEGECGTGAVVPWANRLWAITYGPHQPKGSSDKLYEITPDLRQIIRPESIGGTPANRMIHRESNQLFIGPYAIDAQRNVRAIPYSQMFGRLTANARHLTDPAGKIYFATMEEGVYEVDVKTLAVKELWADEQVKTGRHAELPGYHGKGVYSGQGRLIYSNNGEHGGAALRKPEILSGCLAEWDGKAVQWTVVRRNQFTEITGPGGITGAEHPDTDPVWSIGWDYRSLILMALDNGQWHAYRLPKASHCYDGAHGWNTEWPRIRDIGEKELLMTMHGMFWRFPKTFTARNSAGIAPRSTTLKVIGDFCRWNDRVVFGCDDTAKNEFLNKRKAKGDLAAPGRSQSNLWFIEPARLDQFGTPLGRGAVWFDEPVRAGVPSDPFLFAGFERRGVHLTADMPVTFTFEVDANGDGRWTKLRDVEVNNYAWIAFPAEEKGVWIRVSANRDCAKATAFFQYSNVPAERPALAAGQPTTDGLVRALGGGKCTLGFATAEGYYELDGDLKLKRVNDSNAEETLKKEVAIPKDVLTADAASILYVDEKGKHWRLPNGEIGDGRICREVCTERDIFNAGGTFYELPANNAGGFAKIRPITTHNRHIKDYCSYRGMLVMTGVSGEAPHIIRSDDGKVSLWCGVVDDLWQLGKPRGTGGPWKDTDVTAGQPSDPYLMTGYDRKSLTLSADKSAKIRVEVDLTGTGLWRTWRTLEVATGRVTEYRFPEAFSAYWVRVVADADCTATAEFRYE